MANTNNSVTALANQYIKSLQQVGAGRPQTKSTQMALNLSGYHPKNWGGFDDVIQQNVDPGVGTRILDILSRPLYSVAGIAKATAQNINSLQGDAGAEVRNPFGAAWEGFTGREKTTFSDAIRESLRGDNLDKTFLFGGTPENHIGGSAEDVLAGAGGLALDIALDPSNLVAGGATAAIRAGAKAARGATDVAKAAETAKAAATPVKEVTAVAPVRQYWKEITDPAEIAKYKIPTEVAPAAPAHVIPDEIVKEAITAEPPVLDHIKRSTEQPTTLDSLAMGQHINVLTTKAANNIFQAEKSMPKAPGFIKEINPEEYMRSAQYAVDSMHVSPRQLSQDLGIDYKTAQRHMALMEKDGIVGTAQEAARGRGLEAGRNLSHLSRDVKVNEIPADLMINRTPPTDVTRAEAMYNEVVPAARQKFDELASQGVKPKITSTDGKSYTMSTADIFEALPRNIVEDYNFGAASKKGAGNLYPSQWHAGAAEALRMSELGVEPTLAAPAIAKAMREALRGNASRAKSIEAAGSVDIVARSMAMNQAALAAKLVETSKKFGTKDLVDGETLAKTKADDVQNSMAKGSLSEAIDSVANVGNDISKSAKEIGASNDAAVSAVHQVGPMVAKVVPEADLAAARNAKFAENVRVREGFTPQADKKIMLRQGKLYLLVERNADQIAKEAGIPFLTLGEKTDITLNSFLDKLMHPLKNAFQFGYHTGGQAHEWRALESRADREGLMFRASLSKIAKTHGDSVDPAWTAFRRGQIPEDPAVLAAYNDLKGVIDHTIGNGLRGRLWRNGASIDAINQALEEAGSKFRFKKPAKPEDRALVPEQVRDWDIKDPLPELEKINKAALLIETRQTVGVSASRFGSNVPKPGYVKLRAGELSKLGNYVDTGLFYPRDAGEYIQQLDRLIGSQTSFRGQKGGIAWFANHIIDPIMQIWKPFMTIARPGHVVRNLWSDIMIAAFNGVMSVRPYRIAAKTMQAAGEFTKTGVKGLEKLRDEVVSGSDVAFKYKGQDITYQGLYKMAHNEGILQNWHSTEDIMENTSKIADKMMANRYMQTMGKVNEAEGQFSRLAHFQHLLEKGKSVSEAGIIVRRHHPDVRGLTPFEQKYMRRIFPFYNWFRQAMPVVFSTMLSKPGRVTGLFKAEYNVAQMMGVNPDTLVDPFPNNKLYPQFILDNLTGPIAGNYSVALGMPQEALLNDTLNGSPARNIAGMLNPVFKVPYEVTSRTRVDTGANISDMSDYVDSNIPIVNQVANISGTSITGLGADQRAVEIGEKNRVFNTQLVNFLTGLGLLDTSKPSYKNIATKERAQ